MARKDTDMGCYIYGPHDPIYTILTNEKWRSKIEIIEEGSCSFKLINVKNDLLGEWILTIIYIPKNGREIFRKHLIFSVKGEKIYIKQFLSTFDKLHNSIINYVDIIWQVKLNHYFKQNPNNP